MVTVFPLADSLLSIIERLERVLKKEEEVAEQLRSRYLNPGCERLREAIEGAGFSFLDVHRTPFDCTYKFYDPEVEKRIAEAYKPFPVGFHMIHTASLTIGLERIGEAVRGFLIVSLHFVIGAFNRAPEVPDIPEIFKRLGFSVKTVRSVAISGFPALHTVDLYISGELSPEVLDAEFDRLLRTIAGFIGMMKEKVREEMGLV